MSGFQKHRKLCPKCLRTKSLDQFKLRPDGRSGGYCYKCEIGYYRAYNKKRYASPEARAAELERCRVKYAAQTKAVRAERKKRLIQMLGGRCVRCGYSRSAAALEFDHVENVPGTARKGRRNPVKVQNISHLLALNTPNAFERAVEEAKKCQLLCANCHRERTFPGHELDEKEGTHSGALQTDVAA